MKKPTVVGLTARTAGLVFLLLVVGQAGVWRLMLRQSAFRELGRLGIDEAGQLRFRRWIGPRMLATMSLPLVGAAGLVAWIVALQVRRRVAGLTGAFERIAAGDFDARPPPSPEAELTQLHDAFDAMGQALAASRARAERLDAQRRRLFAELAHELGTPTAAMLTLADTLADPAVQLTAEQRERLGNQLAREAERLRRLLEDLRGLAELEDPDVRFDLHPVALHAVLERASRQCPAPAPELDLRAPEAVLVAGDEERLGQLFDNLLVNARRHGGAQARVRLSTRREGSSVEVLLEDDGPGVPEEALGQLGERLFRVDPARSRAAGGHGLGLAIVRKIAERHGGAVRFERSSLGGLRVAVRLPVLAEEDAQRGQEP